MLDTTGYELYPDLTMCYESFSKIPRATNVIALSAICGTSVIG